MKLAVNANRHSETSEISAGKSIPGASFPHGVKAVD